MAKYWFGSLEYITVQHDAAGHLAPTETKAVKGWKIEADDYPDEASRVKARNALSELWWEDAEQWWLNQPNQIDLKGNEINPDIRHLDHVPIRETNDYQLRITGPIEVPEHPKQEIKKGGK